MSKQNKRSSKDQHQGPNLIQCFINQQRSKETYHFQPFKDEKRGDSTNISFPQMAKAYDIEDEEVDDENQNAVNFQGFQKMKLEGGRQESLAVHSQSSNTVPRHTFEKIALPQDEEVTFKGKISEKQMQESKKQIKKQVPPTASKQKKRPPSEISLTPTVTVPPPVNNAANERIILSDPLRIRFKTLLQKHQLFKIGQSHMELLTLLKQIDSTIQYLGMHRNRFCFFTDLRINLFETRRAQLSKHHIQQLLFLDKDLYEVKWEYYEKGKKYDLQLKQPSIKSRDERVDDVRKHIVQFLLVQQEKWLLDKETVKGEGFGWAVGFDPNTYHIPAAELPPHPIAKSAQINQMTEQQVERIQNTHLRDIMKNIKGEETQSNYSQGVKSRIFSKNNAQAQKFQDLLYQRIRQREKRAAEEEKKKSDPSELNKPPEKAVLEKVGESIQHICMSMGVSNVARQTLIDNLNKRLKCPCEIIVRSIQWMMNEKKVGYLKETILASKVVIVQVDKSKFSQLINAIKEIK